MGKRRRPRPKSRIIVNRRRKGKPQEPYKRELKHKPRTRFVIAMGHREVEKAEFIHRAGYIVTMARRDDVPRYWWYCNWIQDRYQPSGPFMSYNDAWQFACKKLGFEYKQDDWALTVFRAPLGVWHGDEEETPPYDEVMRRLKIRELWELNRMVRLKRGGVLGREKEQEK